VLPSSRLPFLNVSTDGKAKDRHNREILFFSRMLQAAGTKKICLHHVNDAGMAYDLPLTVGKKWYDIAYVAADGEIFLVEIMRIRQIYNPEKSAEENQWQKDE
jgi:hypothetical protein